MSSVESDKLTPLVTVYDIGMQPHQVLKSALPPVPVLADIDFYDDSDDCLICEDLYTRCLLNKKYEITDHLGNVRSVITDRKLSLLDANDTPTTFTPEIKSANNYFPFGMIQPGRSYSSNSYRYGFNGMEKDDEVSGNGNSYDFVARMYNPRLARWMSVDPLAFKTPHESPYLFAGANPIYYIDPDGRTKYTFHIKVAEDGSETVILEVDEDYLEDAGGMMVHDEIVEYIIYNESTGEITTKQGQRVERTWLRAKTKNWSIKEGDGGTLGGGFHFIGDDWGASPTKFDSETAATTIDVQILLDIAGKGGRGGPHLDKKKIQEIVKKWQTLGKEVENEYDVAIDPETEILKDPLRGDTVKCAGCEGQNKEGFVIQGDRSKDNPSPVHVNPDNKDVKNEKINN